MRTGKSHAGRVNLTKYVKLRGAPSEKWRFCPVVHASNGRIRPDYVLIEGRPELHKEGAYYIEWYLDGRRYRESVGKSPSEACAAAERKAQVLRNHALGIEIVGEHKPDRNDPVGGLPRVPRGNPPTPQAENVQPVQDRSRIFPPIVSRKTALSCRTSRRHEFHGLFVRQGPCPPHDLDQGAGCRLDAQSERSYEVDPQSATGRAIRKRNPRSTPVRRSRRFLPNAILGSGFCLNSSG